MESRWRQNIPDLGFGGGGWYLAARELVNPNVVILAKFYDATYHGQRAVLSGGDLVYDTIYPIYNDPAYPHFPFGFAVESDDTV